MRTKLALAFLAVTALILVGNLLLDLALPRDTSSLLTFRALGQASLMLAVGLSAALLLSRQFTRELDHATEEIAGAAEGLVATARSLREVTARFRLQPEPLPAAGDAASLPQVEDSL